MYQGKRVLGLIPARGGSKGIKDKNIADLCGKPLIAYTIEAARGCRYFDSVVVSTDSSRIAQIAREYGAEVPFRRPEALASDTAKTIDAVLHALKELEKDNRHYDVLVLLQPTQPLRDSNDLEKAVEQYFLMSQKPLAGVCAVKDPPVLIRNVGSDGFLKPILQEQSTIRRQDMPLFYRVNGAVYINAVEDLTSRTSLNDNYVPFVMQRSHSLDIDEPFDLEIAKLMIRGGWADLES